MKDGFEVAVQHLESSRILYWGEKKPNKTIVNMEFEQPQSQENGREAEDHLNWSEKAYGSEKHSLKRSAEFKKMFVAASVLYFNEDVLFL